MFGWIKKHWKKIAVVAAAVTVGVVVTVATGGAGAPLLLAAAAGGLASGATGYTLDRWLNHEPWKFGDFARATLVSGALAAATAGVGELASPVVSSVADAVVPEAVSSAVPQVLQSATSNALAGSAFGAGTQVASNLVNGRPVTEGLVQATATGGVTGAVVGPVAERFTPSLVDEPAAPSAPSKTDGVVGAFDRLGGDESPSTNASTTSSEKPPVASEVPPVATTHPGAAEEGGFAAEPMDPPTGISRPKLTRRIVLKLQGKTPIEVAPPAKVDPVADIGGLLDQSSTLGSDYRTLLSEGWTIKYGEAGKGSFCDYNNRTIVVDPSKNDPFAISQTIAHEVGHAVDGTPPYAFRPGMTRDQYVQENAWAYLRSEGAATLENIEVQQQVLRRTGYDIGVSGAHAEEYKQIALDSSLTREQKVDRIAQIFAHGEYPSTGTGGDYYATYSQHYAKLWDQFTSGQGTAPTSAPRAR